MELRRYALLLWRWLWLILLGAVLGGAAAFGVSWQTTPVYESSTTLLISQARASSASPDYTALLTSERLAKTYAELLRKRPVLDAVIAGLQLSTDAETLAAHVRTSAVRDTQLLVLTVDATSPQRAADIANQIVDVFGQQNRDLQTGRYAESERILDQELAKLQVDIDKSQAGLDALTPPLGAAAQAEQARLQALQAQQKDSYTSLLKSLQEIRLAEVQTTDSVNVVESAKAELTPARPRTIVNTLLGAIVGLMLALGVVLLVEYLDDTVKSSEDVAGLIDTMTLSTIAQIGGKEPYQKLVTITEPRAAIAEAYRMLRVNVDFASIDRPVQTLLVTSSGPEEGKSTTAANLAIAIAQAGKRVILVDADLRRPTLHKIFRLPAERGVTTALLQSGTPLESHLARTGIRNLTLMPSGPLPPNPSELLGSQRMVELIEQLRQRADVVVFDSPPALPVVDATILARACDATLLVVLAKRTRSGALRRTREQLAQAGAHVLGVVLNRVPNTRGSAYYSYYGDGRRDKRLRATSLPFMRNEQSAPAQSWIEKSQLVEMPDSNSNGVAP
ncbi:MAG: polysaccharide biosynthesis tyrosine autokinase [Kouleothrix sp.]|nr:polysaccharide biosynthesis tyrosine autokinase [Kouleothrix sp.]